MRRIRPATVVGRPGMGPATLIRRRISRAAVLLTGAVLLGVVAAWFENPWLIAVAGGGAVWVWSVTRAGVARARAGADSEHTVARALRRVRAEAVVFGSTPGDGRGDVDVVVLGPMAAAVEVKRGAGRARVRHDGRVRVGGRQLPGRPAHQAMAAAARVRRSMPEVGHVDAVLCIDRMRGRSRWVPVSGGRVLLCSAARLRKALHRLPGRLDPDEADALVGRLVDPWRPAPWSDRNHGDRARGL